MNARLQLLLVIFIGIIVGVSGIFIWQNTIVQDEIDERDTRISQLESDVEELIKTQSLLTTAPDARGVETEAGLPVAVYVPAGRFSPEQKASIDAKLIRPFFDYYNDDDLRAATMQINHTQDAPFSVDVIFVDGSYSGFLYGDSSLDEQQWWLPECIDSCEFTNAFRGKYPEIVNLSLGL